MAKGIRRKDLKRPDEFVTLSHRALEYIRGNERTIAIGALGIGLLLALALAVRTYRGWQSGRAEEAFGVAYRSLAAGASASAAGAFAEVHSQWPGTPQGRIALAYAGNAYADAGEAEKARAAFDELLRSSDDEVLRQIALYNLGMLDRASGRKDDAAEHLMAAARLDGPLRGVSWLAARETRRDNGSQDVEERIREALAEPARRVVEAEARAAPDVR